MSSQDVETLRGGYAAFARQDIPAVLAAFQPDIEWNDPESLPFGGRYVGHDGVMEFFGNLVQYWQQLEVVPDRFLAEGDTIVVLGHIRGTAAKGSLEQGFVHVWTMRDGKAARFEEFTDTARVNEVLGAGSLAAH